MKFRKKPVVIEAFQVTMTREPTKDSPGIPEWLSEAMAKKWTENGAVYWLGGNLFIQTLEGTHEVSLYDWIIRGVKGELYPCKPDIFEMTYEPVEGECRPMDGAPAGIAIVSVEPMGDMTGPTFDASVATLDMHPNAAGHKYIRQDLARWILMAAGGEHLVDAFLEGFYTKDHVYVRGKERIEACLRGVALRDAIAECEGAKE